MNLHIVSAILFIRIILFKRSVKLYPDRPKLKHNEMNDYNVFVILLFTRPILFKRTDKIYLVKPNYNLIES